MFSEGLTSINRGLRWIQSANEPEHCQHSKMSKESIKRLEAFIRRLEVKIVQRPGTEAIRTPIQPSKFKREISKITNSQNTKRTYCQPSEQLFPKSSLSNPNRTKNNMNTRKVKHHHSSKTINRQQRTTTKLPPWNGQL